MSITSAEGVRLAQSFGVSRVTLARELSLGEVRAIREATDCELEIFVHGALCVAYSGQCFSSEAWGGRSANRGQCAQACRLPYEMIVDGQLQPLGDARYLLSPGDLYALRQVPEIVDIGISALKIEGRYKDADYVALTTAAYRQAVDEAWAGRDAATRSRRRTAAASRSIRAASVRSSSPARIIRRWCKGRAPRHRGVLMGRVREVTEDGVVHRARRGAPRRAAEARRRRGLRCGRLAQSGGTGRRRPHLRDRARWRTCASATARSHAGRIRRGDLVWRTHDPDLDKAARVYTEAAAPVRKQPVSVRVMAREGEPLRTEWTVGAQSA